MILQALRDLALRENLMDDPDFEPKPVRWVIHLAEDGRFLGVVCTDQETAKGKARPLMASVPRQVVRTSGSAANFLVDKAEYVLGFDPDGNSKKAKKLAGHNRLFAEFIESALAFEPDEPALKAILAFLDDDESKETCVAQLQDRAASNDLFCFRYGEDAAAGAAQEREAVRRAWRTMRRPASKSNDSAAVCLVCGEIRAPMRVHPQVKRVPGGSTSGIPLVSFNSSAFLSLGLDAAENASVCQPCAEAYGTALNRLFHPEYPRPGGEVGDVLPARGFRLSEDTSIVYWASGESEIVDEFGDLAHADEAKADALFRSVHEGVESRLDAPTDFHALIVTGGQGRMTLRGYHQTTVGKVAAALRLFFEDVDVAPRSPNAPRRLALRWLIRSLAARGKDKNIDPALAGQVFLAIISGACFPPAVLLAAVQRIRHEPENPDRRAYKHTRERLALIRAAINRRFRAGDAVIRSLINQEVTRMLDESCRNNAYCLGRLLAVLEKLQGDAIGKPNATIIDRYYGAASATPVAAFGTLIRKAQHHLTKMDGPFYSTKIQQILGMLEPSNAFPKTLSLEQQGLFALGYYHQRAALWAGKAANAEATPEPASAEPASAV